MKDYSPRELAERNGKEGNSALVAVKGRVYDVSASKRWMQGNHMKRHQAGQDLSEEIEGAPHGLDVLDRVPLVGKCVQPVQKRRAGLKGKIDTWLDKHPFFRRHPHPAVVHYPVGMLSVAPVFYVFGLYSGSPRTEWVAYCCTIVGLLTIPAAMITGYFTWWINYDMTDFPMIRMKRRLAWIALLIVVISFCVRTFLVDDPLQISDVSVMVYMAGLVVLAVLASYVGFLGGRLTFPYGNE